ncbi:MAG: hypothetical protein ACI81W_003243, partial [Saprospiraceae bacterium]
CNYYSIVNLIDVLQGQISFLFSAAGFIGKRNKPVD